MALKTTWTSANRVVTNELATTYKRELVSATFSNAPVKYFKYTRTRTKKYEYIGLTQAAAKLCAEKMNELYNRHVLKQAFYVGQSSYYFYYITAENQETRPSSPVSAYNDNVADVVVAANVSVSQTSGLSWKVSVDVNEELSYNYTQVNYTPGSIAAPWTAFESSPNVQYLQFCGAIDGKNENYDDAANGYGSPV